MPQAVVHIVRAGGAQTAGRICSQWNYLSRHGKIDVEFSERHGAGPVPYDEFEELAVSWAEQTGNYQRQQHVSDSVQELTTHIVVSFPTGTSQDAAYAAGRDWAQAMFGWPQDAHNDYSEFDYVTAFHKDTDNPHMHVVVNRRSLNRRAEWLAISHRSPRFNYEMLRACLVTVAARHGITLQATPREQNGLAGPALSQQEYHRRQREALPIEFRNHVEADFERVDLNAYGELEVFPELTDVDRPERQQTPRQSPDPDSDDSSSDDDGPPPQAPGNRQRSAAPARSPQPEDGSPEPDDADLAAEQQLQGEAAARQEHGSQKRGFDQMAGDDGAGSASQDRRSDSEVERMADAQNKRRRIGDDDEHAARTGAGSASGSATTNTQQPAAARQDTVDAPETLDTAARDVWPADGAIPDGGTTPSAGREPSDSDDMTAMLQSQGEAAARQEDGSQKRGFDQMAGDDGAGSASQDRRSDSEVERMADAQNKRRRIGDDDEHAARTGAGSVSGSATTNTQQPAAARQDTIDAPETLDTSAGDVLPADGAILDGGTTPSAGRETSDSDDMAAMLQLQREAAAAAADAAVREEIDDEAAAARQLQDEIDAARTRPGLHTGPDMSDYATAGSPTGHLPDEMGNVSDRREVEENLIMGDDDDEQSEASDIRQEENGQADRGLRPGIGDKSGLDDEAASADAGLGRAEDLNDALVQVVPSRFEGESRGEFIRRTMPERERRRQQQRAQQGRPVTRAQQQAERERRRRQRRGDDIDRVVMTRAQTAAAEAQREVQPPAAPPPQPRNPRTRAQHAAQAIASQQGQAAQQTSAAGSVSRKRSHQEAVGQTQQPAAPQTATGATTAQRRIRERIQRNPRTTADRDRD